MSAKAVNIKSEYPSRRSWRMQFASHDHDLTRLPGRDHGEEPPNYQRGMDVIPSWQAHGGKDSRGGYREDIAIKDSSNENAKCSEIEKTDDGAKMWDSHHLTIWLFTITSSMLKWDSTASMFMNVELSPIKICLNTTGSLNGMKTAENHRMPLL
jgi:hypothetical protein